MKITARTAGLVAACSLWACTASSPSPAPEPVAPELATLATTPEDVSVFVARTVTPPTADMLKAALSNDPDAMRDAIALTTTCQAATTCPTQFASCTAWSTPSLCSSTCGASQCFCRPIRLCEGEPPVPRQVDTFNSFRICFDPNQNACTEWQQTISSFCGC